MSKYLIYIIIAICLICICCSCSLSIYYMFGRNRNSDPINTDTDIDTDDIANTEYDMLGEPIQEEQEQEDPIEERINDRVLRTIGSKFRFANKS